MSASLSPLKRRDNVVVADMVVTKADNNLTFEPK